MANFKINAEELQFLQGIGGGKPKDEKLYGFIPGRWLPNWVKQGYNQSIEGMAQEIINGKPVFKTDVNYNPSMLEDIGAGIVSFLTPTDFAAMALGGGVGGLALKASSKKAVAAMVKSGLSKEAAEQSVKKASTRVFNQARDKAVTGATGLGFYSGLQSALGQQVTEGDIDFARTLKDAAVGGALGGASAALGVTSKAVAKDKGLGKRTAFAVEKGTEVGVFGTAEPILLEGELPTAEGYIRAAGTIGGLTLSTAAAKRIFNPRSRNLKPEELETLYRSTAESELQVKLKKDLAGQIWTDGKRKVKLTKDVFDEANAEDISVREVGTNKIEKISRSAFFASTKDGGFRLFQDSKGKNVDDTIRGRTFKLVKENNISEDTLLRIINRNAGEDFPQKKSINRSTKKKDVVSTNYDLIKDNYEARLKTLRDIERIDYLEKSMKSLRDQGMDITEWSGDSIFKKALPDFAYKILTSTLPITSKVKAPEFQVGFKDIQRVIQNIDIDRAKSLRRYDYKLTREAVYITRQGKRVKGIKNLNKEERIQLAEDLQNPKAQNRVKGYRKILDEIYNESKELGVPVASYEDFYLSKMIKGDLLKKVRDDIAKLGGDFDIDIMKFQLEQRPGFEQRLTNALNNQKISDDTLRAIQHIKGELTSLGLPSTNSRAFEVLRGEAIKDIVFTAKNLEVNRKPISLPDYFYEKDAGIVLTKYIGKASKRQGFVKNAGVNGEIVHDKINALKSLGGHKEGEILYKALGAITGSIELDKNYNWSPSTKNIFNDLVNIQVATKIGLGFATIPNLTQPFISSVLKTGYAPFIKGTYNYLTNTLYRQRIRKYAGENGLELNAMLVGFNPDDMSFTARAADFLTRKSGFQGINSANKLISAYTGYEAALRWQKIARTSSSKLRREWAKTNLQQMGIKNINKKLTQKNLAGAMYEFARDTQLQKNVFREPAFFNDPRFQPFVLFKRFGYRQFEWLQGELRKEVSQGNLAILLRLGIAGFAGGQFVGWARNALADLLSGKFDNSIFGQEIGTAKDVYSEGYSYSIDGKNFTLADYIDSLASVGAMGIVGDILASESRWRALEFAAKPAIIQDAGKAYTALQKLITDIETFGPTGITLQRSVRNIAPMAGSAARRVLERFETPKQRQDYVKFRLGRTRAKILDAMIDGDDAFANRLIKQWNNSFPERILTYEDIGPEAINQRLLTKYKKQINP